MRTSVFVQAISSLLMLSIAQQAGATAPLADGALAPVYSVVSSDKISSDLLIPIKLRGRWVQLSADGSTVSARERCEEAGRPSADLVIGPNWAMNAIQILQVLDVQRLESGDVRIELVDNEGGEIAVSVEFFRLGDDSDTLEIASDPDIGWEVSRYVRCVG